MHTGVNTVKNPICGGLGLTLQLFWLRQVFELRRLISTFEILFFKVEQP